MVQRGCKRNLYIQDRTYTIFKLFSWKQCECCNKEFRREFGWVYLHYYGEASKHMYVCKRCAPTRHEAGSKLAQMLYQESPVGLDLLEAYDDFYRF